MSHLDLGVIYSGAGQRKSEPAWTEDMGARDLADVLRYTLREEYADASDEQMADALENVLEAMSPAEAFNFGSALNQIGRSASRLASDPAFIQVVRSAAPVAGGALGTVIGGPVGTALGSQLGNLAAKALAPKVAPSPAPAAPVVAEPAPAAAASPPPGIPLPAAAQPVAGDPAAAAPAPTAAATSASDIPPHAPKPGSPVGGGSAAAAQALVLCQQPDMLRSLLATALGQHGRQQVSGVPAAQVINLFSQVLGQAAADADELMYLGQQPDAADDIAADEPAASARSLYGDLLGADNLELAEAAQWDGLG